MKINFGEIKKWLWAAGGLLGLLLTTVVDTGWLPADSQWLVVIRGVIAVLALAGVYQAKGPTGIPVFQKTGKSTPIQP